MFERLGDTYQMHIVTEADRAWLEETLVNVPEAATVDNAIKWGQQYDPKKRDFPVSVITSRQDDGVPLLWSFTPVTRVGSVCIIDFKLAALHPSARGMGYSQMVLECIEWLIRENWWNIDIVTCSQSPWLEDVPLSWGSFVKKNYSNEQESGYSFDLRALANGYV